MKEYNHIQMSIFFIHVKGTKRYISSSRRAEENPFSEAAIFRSRKSAEAGVKQCHKAYEYHIKYLISQGIQLKPPPVLEIVEHVIIEETGER